MKKIVITIILTFIFLGVQATDEKYFGLKLTATTEKEMYKIYEQFLDSMIHFKIDNRITSIWLRTLKSKDTLMILERYCIIPFGYGGQRYETSYGMYISDTQPISFYQRFLIYLESLWREDNTYYKNVSCGPLVELRQMFIKKYETEELSAKERKAVFEIIEHTTLRLIKNSRYYYFLFRIDERYVTKKIRQALVESIDNPFYSESYWDFYFQKGFVDTMTIDTTGMPAYIIKLAPKYPKPPYIHIKEEYQQSVSKLYKFYKYEEMGRELGLSPGQAYIADAKKRFRRNGCTDINPITEYAVIKKDTLLIEHLKEFRRKHPDNSRTKFIDSMFEKYKIK